MKNSKNIALFAHVDAGKTSITEQFLYYSGKIRNLGSVDKGNTQTDFLDIEKQRGITVNSSIVSFEWKDTTINLIDTPGHVDFSSEAERAVYAIDAAVVIISAVEGIEAQTESVINLLQKHQKPFLIFINKIDRDGTDIDIIIDELKHDLQCEPLLLQTINNQTDINASWNETDYTNNPEIIESLVALDTTFLENYLNDSIISFSSLDSLLIKVVKKQELVPILLGSAKLALGIDFLLDAIIKYLPNPENSTTNLSGIVFKTSYNKKDGKWNAIRLFGGILNSRETIYYPSKNKSEKVSIIKNTDLQNQKILQSFSAGEIAWVQGLNEVQPGDFIGEIPKNIPINNTENIALLTVQLKPINQKDINDLVTAISILSNEDPDLNFTFIKDEGELHINIRGEIHKEILQSLLLSRFGLEVKFSKPTVIYKETPTKTTEGYVRYWLPKPCWAIMRFKIEPGKRGSGIQYTSNVGVNDIKIQYQKDVEKTIPKALKQGILGWQVDDIKITLIEGEDHEVHTKSNDFAIATPMGIMDGLSEANMTLLEPILQFKIRMPEHFIGNVTAELIRLRANIENPEINNNKVLITGTIPLATSLDLPIKLSSITGGKAKIITKFDSYQTCDINLGKTREYKGISPLDTAKYILKARKALS